MTIENQFEIYHKMHLPFLLSLGGGTLHDKSDTKQNGKLPHDENEKGFLTLALFAALYAVTLRHPHRQYL